jgi:hypothetical protein
MLIRLVYKEVRKNSPCICGKKVVFVGDGKCGKKKPQRIPTVAETVDAAELQETVTQGGDVSAGGVINSSADLSDNVVR